MNLSLTEAAPNESELHLRSGVILSIFMGITMVSAVFFGLGYSFGRTGTPGHSSPASLTLQNSAPVAALPAAPAPMVAAAPVLVPATPVLVPAAPAATNSPSAIATSVTNAAVQSAALPSVKVAVQRVPAKKITALHAAYLVQVAAVARRKDALSVVASLHKHGFSARLHTTTHDRFFHVQLGPFATQQQADAIRHKVMAAGFRAILKPA